MKIAQNEKNFGFSFYINSRKGQQAGLLLVLADFPKVMGQGGDGGLLQTGRT